MISFDKIANRYDFINQVISLGMVNVWRRKLLEKIDFNVSSILDVGCGTGKLMLEIKKQFDGRLVGIDSSIEMLKLAPTSLNTIHSSLFDYHEKFDLIIMSFVLRNLPVQRALKKAKELLNDGGCILIMEFNNGNIFSRFFTNHIMPIIAFLLGGRYRYYKYLAKSIFRFNQKDWKDKFKIKEDKCFLISFYHLN